jgi:tetratricopeptide (TPR) repeat protein
MNMASEPSIFYANRDNYLASLDASSRAAEQTREFTGAMEKYAQANLAGQALMTQNITSSLTSGFSGMNDTLQTGFNGMGNAMEHGFSSMGNAMEYGFSSMGNAMERGFSGVKRDIGEMGAAMNYGFARLNDTVEQSARSVCAELREINKTLNRPLQTQALELYTMAQEDYGKKLYEDARDKLRQSIDLYKSYYLAWFLLGKVYLFGEAGEFSAAVTNPDEAVKALTEAAKYAGAEAQNNESARAWAAEICFYLGLARYRKYYAFLGKGGAENEKTAAYLDETLRIFDRSWAYSNKMLEARYLGAACKFARGNAAGAKAYLEMLIDADPRYAVKAAKDPAFT